jgi:peptidoglycan/LPS O-acetylase OafA/YrhL
MQSSKVRVHYGEVDGYRGIAALLIVLLHAYQKPGISIDRSTGAGIFVDLLLRNLDLAVDWFFVLSGFLLFLPFVRAALEQQGQLSSRDFLRRRMYRIIPAYYLVLLVFWLLGTPKWPNSWIDLLEHLTFTHIFNPAHMFSIVGPAWSLANEMVYYLLLAIIGPLSYWLCGMFGSLRARAGPERYRAPAYRAESRLPRAFPLAPRFLSRCFP